MVERIELINKLDNEIVKYMEMQGRSELKKMLDALEDYLAFRTNLSVMPLEQPSRVALMNCPDLLLAIDVAKKTHIKDSQIYESSEFAYKVVGDVYRKERAALLAARIQVELTQYHNELKTLTPDEIVDRSHQTTLYNDFSNILSNPTLTARQIDTLMTYPNILNSLYVEWICGNYVHTNELEDCLKKCIENQDIYLQGNPECSVDKGEKAIWDQMYEGDEFRVSLDDEVLDEEVDEDLEV